MVLADLDDYRARPPLRHQPHSLPTPPSLSTMGKGMGSAVNSNDDLSRTSSNNIGRVCWGDGQGIVDYLWQI